MKAVFNPDGTMFMVGPDHMPIPEHLADAAVWFPDDLNYRKRVEDELGNKGVIEVTRSELAARYDKYMQDYVNARKLAYPSIVDQLDLLYHEGYDGWRGTIEKIKNEHPKKSTPESI